MEKFLSEKVVFLKCPRAVGILAGVVAFCVAAIKAIVHLKPTVISTTKHFLTIYPHHEIMAKFLEVLLEKLFESPENNRSRPWYLRLLCGCHPCNIHYQRCIKNRIPVGRKTIVVTDEDPIGKFIKSETGSNVHPWGKTRSFFRGWGYKQKRRDNLRVSLGVELKWAGVAGDARSFDSLFWTRDEPLELPTDNLADTEISKRVGVWV